MIIAKKVIEGTKGVFLPVVENLKLNQCNLSYLILKTVDFCGTEIFNIKIKFMIYSINNYYYLLKGRDKLWNEIPRIQII